MKDDHHSQRPDRQRPDRQPADDRDGDFAGVPGNGEEATLPTPLTGIGAALRRLRMHRGLRQYEAAEAAGITKAMLSAYETGKRRPSLKTLDSLLKAMDANLGHLHTAMMEVRRAYRPHRAPSWEVREATPLDRSPEGRWEPTRPDLYALLGIEGPLPPEEERALEEMLRGFLNLLRYMHHRLERSARAAEGWSGGR